MKKKTKKEVKEKTNTTDEPKIKKSITEKFGVSNSAKILME